MHNGILKAYAIDGTAIPSIFGARLAKDKTGAVSFRKWNFPFLWNDASHMADAVGMMSLGLPDDAESAELRYLHGYTGQVDEALAEQLRIHQEAFLASPQ